MSHFVPSTVVARQPPDFFQLPAIVILDLSDAIRKFFQAVAASTDECEFYIDQLLAEALLFISQDWRANDGLEAFRLSYLNCFLSDGHMGVSMNEATTISDAAKRLAAELLAALRHYGLYASDGMLHYELAKNWIDERTPILERHITLTRVKTG